MITDAKDAMYIERAKSYCDQAQRQCGVLNMRRHPTEGEDPDVVLLTRLLLHLKSALDAVEMPV
jgi:hypothetical protein